MSLSYELRAQLFEESFSFDRGQRSVAKMRQADLDHRCQHVLHLSYRIIYTLLT
jgi:hypothetical protein